MIDMNSIMGLINGIYYNYHGNREQLLINLDYIAKLLITEYNLEGLNFKSEEELHIAQALFKELTKIKSFLKGEPLMIYELLERKLNEANGKRI